MCVLTKHMLLVKKIIKLKEEITSICVEDNKIFDSLIKRNIFFNFHDKRYFIFCSRDDSIFIIIPKLIQYGWYSSCPIKIKSLCKQIS